MSNNTGLTVVFLAPTAAAEKLLVDGAASIARRFDIAGVNL
jgi:hypothetical protein